MYRSMTIEFTIKGNQEDPEGNPVPFQRVIKQMWRKQSTRYHEWMEYVRKAYLRAVEKKKDLHPAFALFSNKPINLSLAGGDLVAKVETHIYWKNGAHGDPDNVYKGILDSIFSDDKGVIEGHYWSQVAPDGKGRVEVKIVIQ